MKLKLLKETTVRKEPKVILDFLEPELQDFISLVTDVTRKRWLSDYTEDQLSNKILDCYEWCEGRDHKPKSVGMLIRKFLKDVPKKSDGDAVARKLDAILAEGK